MDANGRNHNGNYELDAAYVLEKEIIINIKFADVPLDYRHIRYIKYNRGVINWKRELFETIENVLFTVLARFSQAKNANNSVRTAIKLMIERKSYTFAEELEATAYFIKKTVRTQAQTRHRQKEIINSLSLVFLYKKQRCNRFVVTPLFGDGLQ